MSRTVRGKGNSNVAMWLSGDIPGALCIRIHCQDVPGTAYLSIVDAEELIEHLHQFTTGKLEEPEKEKRKVYTVDEIARMKCPYSPEPGYTATNEVPKEKEPTSQGNCPHCGAGIAPHSFGRICQTCLQDIDEKPDKPKCERCGGTGEIFTIPTFGQTQYQPCPDCGESGEAKTVNIGGVDFKEIDAATAEEACTPHKGGEFHVTPKYKATGITESEYKESGDEEIDSIFAVKNALELSNRLIITDRVARYNAANIYTLQRRIEDQSKIIGDIEKRDQEWRAPVANLLLDFAALEKRVEELGKHNCILVNLEQWKKFDKRVKELKSKLNERIEKSKTWENDVVERLEKLEGC